MYSLNDMTNGFKKMEPQEEIPSNGTSNQMVSTGEIPVVKEETKDATCSMVGQKLSPLPPKSGYPETSLGEVSNRNDVMNIKISNIQGASSFQNGFKDETIKTGDQIENQFNKLPSSDEFQSSFDYSIQENMPIAQEYRDGQLAKHSIAQKEMYPEGTELRSPINQPSFHPLPVYQMSINWTMPSDQFDAQNDSREIGSSCHEQMDANVVAPPNMSSHNPVPLHHIDTQEELTSPQIGDIQKDTRYQAPNYQPEISFFHGGYYSHESLNVPKFNEKQIYDAGPNRNRSASYQCCQCCCHSPTQNEPNYVPPLSLENQRPSVIMVPVNWSNISSGTSHVPFKVNTPYSLPSQHGVVNSPYSLHSQNRPNVTNGLGYRNDYDSSDEDDDERQEKYFRFNIDGTTARFKLTRADWERIPINTFPSGGRLLSGDWTRIFLEKVKESNPWCSLRFKNNHVRSENSRKIHSAVFFRGGAECKRPECNVKVRFVIQKEKGKYVDVTYVGNVCHSSQPDGGGRNRNRVRGIVF